MHKYQISLKSVHWELSCFSGHTDMTKLIVVLYNVANLLKNHYYIHDKIMSKSILVMQFKYLSSCCLSKNVNVNKTELRF